MSHINGTDREQLNMFPLTMDEMVGEEYPVRIVELFI